MAQAREGDTVRVHYTGRLEDGTVFDSSANNDPLQFTIGQHQMVPGFEEAVVGMEAGEAKSVKIPPGKAYGPRHEEMVLITDRKEIPPHVNLEVGRTLRVGQGGQGPTLTFTVTDLTESSVTLDANHPLAGRELVFDIQLIEVL